MNVWAITLLIFLAPLAIVGAIVYAVGLNPVDNRAERLSLLWSASEIPVEGAPKKPLEEHLQGFTVLD